MAPWNCMCLSIGGFNIPQCLLLWCSVVDKTPAVGPATVFQSSSMGWVCVRVKTPHYNRLSNIRRRVVLFSWWLKWCESFFVRILDQLCTKVVFVSVTFFSCNWNKSFVLTTSASTDGTSWPMRCQNSKQLGWSSQQQVKPLMIAFGEDTFRNQKFFCHSKLNTRNPFEAGRQLLSRKVTEAA